MSTVTQLITAEEFLAMDLGEGIHELVRGEIVEMSPAMMEHGIVCGNGATLLGVYGKETRFGYIATNDSAILTERGPDTVRGADICFYSHARWPRDRIGKGLVPIPPDLVVEVVSPSKRAGELLEKIGEYLRVGVLMVWIVEPTKKRLLIYRAGDLDPTIYTLNDVVENLPELPGFRCLVPDFFA